MSLDILFHFLCAQHVSDINISIIRSLQLFCWITALVCVLGSMCVGVLLWLGWSGIRVAGLSGACDYSVELPHWSYCSWFDVCWIFGVVGLEWYPCCRLQHSFSLQQGYHSNSTIPKLQHTSNQEQYDHCGNSTQQSQAPDDGYINVRNMLST